MKIPIISKAMFIRGLLSSGHSQPLENLRKKLESKQSIIYGAIGGSITQGAAASDGKRTAYAPLFASWLSQRAPCELINAGVGATTSMFGAFRVQQDMLYRKPDIITIEFAVNDVVNPDVEASYEALVRQCVDSPGKPLVILIFTMCADGTNLQDRHVPIGVHYALPMLSYRDAVYPEIGNGGITWNTISPDEVHPNDCGHAFIAAMLERFIDTSQISGGGVKYLPDMLYPKTSKYLGGRVVDAVHMEILENSGWTQYDHDRNCTGLESTIPGSYLRLKVKSGTVLIGYVKYSGNFGMAKIKIDGTEICGVDGYYEKPDIQEWAGGHTILEPIVNGESGTEHLIEIELMKRHHLKSDGNHFKISYFLCGK